MGAIKIGRYRHYKGNEYEVLYIARHSETGEDMVVYRALYGNHDIWVRPASMWNDIVVVNGESKKRFEYLPPQHFLFVLQDYFVKNGLARTSPIDTAVAERKAGKQYSLSDHIRGLVYSLLECIFGKVLDKFFAGERDQATIKLTKQCSEL